MTSPILLGYSYMITFFSGGTTMPIYEYECLQCGKNHELMQKFSDALLTACPECGGELKKLISNTSFVLKGSGWYITDYARKSDSSAKESSNKKDTAKLAAASESKAATASNAAKNTDSPKSE